MLHVHRDRGVLTTNDGSEKASYIFHAVGNGKLAFLNNIISFFMVEVDLAGNFLSIERELNKKELDSPAISFLFDGMTCVLKKLIKKENE